MVKDKDNNNSNNQSSNSLVFGRWPQSKSQSVSSNGSVHLSKSQGSRRSAAESETLAKHKRAKIEFQLSEISSSSSRVRGSSSARLRTAAGDRKNEETPPTQKIEIKIEFVVEVGDRRWMLLEICSFYSFIYFAPV